MQKLSNIFRKIVLITGILNFPIGLMMIVPAFINPNPETLITTVVVGAFIMFAGATLVWSSRDLQTRASIVVWNGLVRAIGVLTVIYTTTIGNVPMEQIVITGLDLMLALIYTIGSVKVTGISFGKLLSGKS
ncbi:hypothetical protein [Ancylomarina sp. 16SWW S1-10-2]|uniref:hypothetical protein n=1 Tax=Ancylomarina sp. 16SWW S1-10-2 TaxID=2499681 RepID=UPI0012AE1746|nr:hypothetical protein [Ancylomarina sp. 16SWW S1-10-2]MRT92889.1 hypothetical protein [Ancylomarina sp. 16SWW S1-10-2]